MSKQYSDYMNARFKKNDPKGYAKAKATSDKVNSVLSAPVRFIKAVGQKAKKIMSDTGYMLRR